MDDDRRASLSAWLETLTNDEFEQVYAVVEKECESLKAISPAEVCESGHTSQ